MSTCYFTTLSGCNFNYPAPIVVYQVLSANYTLYHRITPALIGMNLSWIEWVLPHEDLHQLLKHAKEQAQQILIAVHHDITDIKPILECVQKIVRHSWWESLLGWSPLLQGY